MNVAIIPARGGSKRIPRKNIRQFCGKPMIVWSIEVARRSDLFDYVVVSTDDDEIMMVAREAGADVPFRRPAELSDDHTTTRPVVKHAIREVSRDLGYPDRVCCIYPTAPFIRVSDLKKGLQLLSARQPSFVFAATSFPFPIQRAFRLTENGGVKMLYPEYRDTRSQDLEQTFHDAGQFYWGRAEAFLAGKKTFSEESLPLILPRFRVHDIDTEEDWRRAELIYEAMHVADVAAGRDLTT